MLDVPDGAKLKLRMSDGSVIALGASTRMTVQAYAVDNNGDKRDVRLQVGSGLIRAVVSKVSQPSSFEVATAMQQRPLISPARWFVEVDPSVTRVSVLEGTVAVVSLTQTATVTAATRSPAANVVLVPSRSVSTIAAKKQPTPPTKATQADFNRLIEQSTVPIGWCQCIADATTLHAACKTGFDECKGYCSNKVLSFIPTQRIAAPNVHGEGVALRRTASRTDYPIAQRTLPTSNKAQHLKRPKPGKTAIRRRGRSSGAAMGVRLGA